LHVNRGNKNSIKQNYVLELLSHGSCVTKVACGNWCESLFQYKKVGDDKRRGKEKKVGKKGMEWFTTNYYVWNANDLGLNQTLAFSYLQYLAYRIWWSHGNK
jgi:hypothetical protein